MSPVVANILTSANSRVSGVVRGKLPKELLLWAKPLSLDRAALLDYPWDHIPVDVRIATMSKALGQNNNTGEGFQLSECLKVKEEIQLSFDKTTHLFGQTFTPGKHLLKTADIFGPVDYKGILSRRTFSGVEFRIRFRDLAGTVEQDSKNFYRLAGLPPTSLHLHIPGKLGLFQMKANPRLEIAERVHFWCLLNLHAEMAWIKKNRHLRQKEVLGYIPVFGHLTRDQVEEAAVSLGEAVETGTFSDELRFKVALVGLRGGNTYDEPGLWGMEPRFLSRVFKPKENEAFLNMIQQRMLHQDFRIGQIKEWVKAEPHDLSKRLANAWYQGGNDRHVLDAPPPDLAKQVKKWSERRRNLFLDDVSSARELSMLTYNWANSPVAYKDPQFVEQMISAQLAALKKWGNKINISQLMNEFLKESGLDLRVEALLIR